MADPRAGAFGVGAAAAILLVRWSALSVLPPSPLLLAGLWCASRTSMAVVVRTRPYARPSGLASAFVNDDRAPGAAPGNGNGRVALAVTGLAGSLALAGVASGLGGMMAVGGLGLAAVAVTALAQRRLGGFTGDVLGAAGLVGETVGLAVAAARLRR